MTTKVDNRATRRHTQNKTDRAPKIQTTKSMNVETTREQTIAPVNLFVTVGSGMCVCVCGGGGGGGGGAGGEGIDLRCVGMENWIALLFVICTCVYV